MNNTQRNRSGLCQELSPTKVEEVNRRRSSSLVQNKVTHFFVNLDSYWLTGPKDPKSSSFIIYQKQDHTVCGWPCQISILWLMLPDLAPPAFGPSCILVSTCLCLSYFHGPVVKYQFSQTQTSPTVSSRSRSKYCQTKTLDVSCAVSSVLVYVPGSRSSVAGWI